METFKESAMRLRQADVKPTAKIMATQHIEKGNMKKTLDLLKHIGKKVKVDKSTEKTSKAIWTIEGTMEKSMEEKSKGLWHNIRKKRERGEPKAKPGDKDYPKTLNIESTELDENKLKSGDKVKTPQGTVEIKARDTSAMRGKQDKFTMILHMKNGKKASMGSHPAPTASAVTNIAKRFDKGVPSYMANLSTESLDEAIDFRKAFMDIQSYAKKSGGMDKTDFEKVAYYVKAIGDNQNTPNVANKAFMAMKKHIDGLDTDVRDGIHVLLKKHGMVKNGRLVQESLGESDYTPATKSTDVGGKPLLRKQVKKAIDKKNIAKQNAMTRKYNKMHRESVELDENYRTLAIHGMVKNGRLMQEGKWFVRQSAKPNKTGTYQGKQYDDGKKAIAQARKDWKLTSDEHMSAKMMKEAIEEGLDARQIALLKKNYASIDRVDPNGPAYKKAKGMISGLDKDTQMDLAKAKVKFLSQIAADELRKQHGVKLKAKDYMESVTTKSFSELR